jgi:hypothetical protein
MATQTQPTVTIEDIRYFLRDNLARNDLLERLEFTDAEVEKAMQMTTDLFNLIPPISYWSVTGFPNRALMILGAASVLLTSEAFAQARNQLTYSDGGIHVGVDDKAALYLQLGEQMRAQFQQAATDLKIQMNAEQAFGGFASPYYGLPIF